MSQPVANSPPVVIVGAGPAGIRAAQTLMAHGVKPCLIDEAARGGGQIYRQQPSNFLRKASELYGFDAAKAQAVHQAIDQLATAIDYRPDTLVWSAEAGRLDYLQQRDGQSRAGHLAFSRLLIASGATERILPVPGWTLPGVYSLGAAQIALKYQGCAIGEQVVFCGSGPLLYLVAYQYAKAGAKVLAVLDSGSFRDQCRALPALLNRPATLAKGIYYRAWLALHGIPVHQGAEVQRFDGEQRVQAVVWRQGAYLKRLDCDAVAFAQGLRSETQLADLLGCTFDWDAVNRAWLPGRDSAGRSSVEGVYLAGDGVGILGADAAQLAGERAALALLEDLGHPVDAARCAELERQLARTRRFRVGLEQAFAVSADWAAHATDQTILCRCEEVSVGEVREVVDQGHWELNRVKAHCRVGMGRCQGRMCGAAAAEIVAQRSGRALHEVGRMRAQAPIKPLPFGLESADE